MSEAAQLGRFRALGPLGEGGMGRVLRGAHVGTATPVAIKILSAEGMANKAIRKAFANEARAVAALSHPGIVRILDYGVVPEDAGAASGGLLTAGSPYLVMPLAEGGTLRRHRALLRWSQLRTLLLGLLDALGHAHARGVIHRDIKPGNVLMVDADDPLGGTWLADFGLVQLTEERHPGAVRLYGGGTPPFMAPEQQLNDLDAQGPWTDLYALGQLAIFMASGGQSRLKTPRGFEGWLEQLTADDPARRFQFAAHAAEALARLDVGSPTFSTRWREESPASPLLPAMSPAVLSLRPPPMVGRRNERERLWRALLGLRRDRELRVLRIEGPAGSGRSRLAEWFAEQAHERGLARSMRVRFLERAGGRDPVAEGLATLLRVRSATPAKAAERLRELLPEPRWTEAERRQLAALLVNARPEVPSVRVGGQPERRALLRRAILEAAREMPLVLVLDDLHFELDGVELLKSLCAPVGRSEAWLMVVLTTSAEALAWLPTERAALEELERSVAVDRLRLAPLSHEEHAALVRGILGVPRGLVAEVIERTLGDPRFAVQLVRQQVESGALVPADGGWRRVAEVPLPDALQDLYTQRLLRLMGPWSPEAQRALLLAAVLGVEVDEGEWTDACAVAGIAPHEGLVEALARAGLVIHRGDGGWRFSSSLVRACLVAMATELEVAPELHLACARSLPERAVERRAMHLLGAGARAEALGPLTRAMQQRLQAARLDQAERLAELWLDLVDAIDLSENPRARIEGAIALGSLRLGQGQLDEASVWIEQAWAQAAALGDPSLEAAALRAAALHAWHAADIERYVEHSQRAKDLSQGRERARAQLDLAYGLHLLGRADEALAEAEAAERAFTELGDDHGALDALRFRSNGLVSASPGPEALNLARALREQAEALGSVESLAAGWFNEGELMRHEAEFDAAAEAFRQGAELLDAAGSAHGLVGWISVGVVRVEQGRHSEARRDLEACLGLAHARGLQLYEGYIVSWLLRAIAGVGAWEAMRPEWRQVDLSVAQVYGEEMLGALSQAGRAAELVAEVDGADLCWSLALEVATRLGDHAGVAQARAAQARVDALNSALSRGVPTLPPEI